MIPLWFVLALTSAVMWGLGYALSEKIFQQGISPVFYMLFTGIMSIVMTFGLSFWIGDFQKSLQTALLNKNLFLLMMLTSFCYVVGGLLVYFAIAEKNATLVGLIEISYPIFTMLFAWLLFRDVQINAYAVISMILIFSGIGLLYLKS